MFKYILSKRVVVKNNAVLFSRNNIQFFSTLQKKNINNLVIDKIKSLKQSMDNAVVGHTNVKNGICLALIAKQHVYIEGPPGSAKTLLAETTANETNSKIFFTPKLLLQISFLWILTILIAHNFVFHNKFWKLSSNQKEFNFFINSLICSYNFILKEKQSLSEFVKNNYFEYQSLDTIESLYT